MEALTFFVFLGVVILVFVLPIYAAVKVSQLSRLFGELNERVDSLQAKVDGLHRQAQETHPKEKETPVAPRIPERSPLQPAPEIVQTYRPVSSQPMIPRPPVPGRALEQGPPTGTEVAATFESHGDSSQWEVLVTGNWLNRIGAVALLIAAGFFLKYAFEHNWITPWLRVGIGVLAGVSLLVAGAQVHRRELAVFAQGLVGAGIAILYLSVYASYNLYNLVPQPVAFVCMSLLTVVALQQSLRYDSQAVSLIGVAGGFLTPKLASSPFAEPNTIGLFVYVALLDICLLIISVRRREWAALEPLALIGTYSTYLMWKDAYLTPQGFGTAYGFLAFFWGLFYAADLYRHWVIGEGNREVHTAVAIANVFFYALAVYDLLAGSRRFVGLYLLDMSLIYAATPVLLSVRRIALQTFAARYYVTAIVLAGLSTHYLLDGYFAVMAWGIEALALVWIGRKTRSPYICGCALALLAVATLKLVTIPETFAYEPIQEFQVVLNLRFMAFIFLVLAAILSTLAFRGGDDDESAWRSVLHFWWIALLFTLVTIEIGDYFRRLMALSGGTKVVDYEFVRSMFFPIIWSCMAVSLVSLGLTYRNKVFLYSGALIAGLAVLFVSIAGLSYRPVSAFVPIANVRVAGMMVTALSLGTLVWLMRVNRDKYDSTRGASRVLYIVISVLLFELVSVETWDYFARQIHYVETSWFAAETERIRDMRQAVLSVEWLVYSIGLLGIGIWRRVDTLRYVAIALFYLTIFKVFLYDLSSLETLYRIFSFLGLGLILLATSYLYQRYKGLITGVQGME